MSSVDYKKCVLELLHVHGRLGNRQVGNRLESWGWKSSHEIKICQPFSIHLCSYHILIFLNVGSHCASHPSTRILYSLDFMLTLYLVLILYCGLIFMLTLCYHVRLVAYTESWIYRFGSNLLALDQHNHLIIGCWILTITHPDWALSRQFDRFTLRSKTMYYVICPKILNEPQF